MAPVDRFALNSSKLNRLVMRRLLLLAAAASTLFGAPPGYAAKDNDPDKRGEVWAPGQEMISLNLLDAVSTIQNMLDTEEVNLCPFVGIDGWQSAAKMTGHSVTLTCASTGSTMILSFGSNFLSVINGSGKRSDRLMACARPDAQNPKGRQDNTTAGWYCTTSARRYDRATIRRFVTAWDALQEWENFNPSDEYIGTEINSKARITPADQEDLRRTQIQVELAVKQNRLIDAARLYDAAVLLHPDWAEGRFNYALLLEQLELYQRAIVNMRFYLRLAPNSSVARDARDRIYVWEVALKKGHPIVQPKR